MNEDKQKSPLERGYMEPFEADEGSENYNVELTTRIPRYIVEKPGHWKPASKAGETIEKMNGKQTKHPSMAEFLTVISKQVIEGKEFEVVEAVEAMRKTMGAYSKPPYWAGTMKNFPLEEAAGYIIGNINFIVALNLLAGPEDKETFINRPLGEILYPIGLYKQKRNLAVKEAIPKQSREAELSEAQLLQFIAFFLAYWKEWLALDEAERSGEDIGDAQRKVMRLLVKQGIMPRKRAVKGEAIPAAQGKKGEVIPSMEEPAGGITTLETALAALQGFSYALQGPLTAALSMTRATLQKPGQLKIDELTGTAQIERGQFILTINNFTELRRGLDDTTQMLLDALIIRFTESPPQNGLIELPLRDYMEMRGLKDEKEARKQVKEGLEALQRCTVQGFRGYGKNKGDYLKVTLYGGAGVYGIKNSVIIFSISPIYYATLLEYKAMPRPDRLLTIDTSRHKHAYALGTYIYWQKYINAGKPRENIMTVKALLAACPNLPSYEELDKTKGEISRKIIEPFRNNLNVLEDMGFFTWAFCHSKGEPLTPEEEELDELGGMPYGLFETLRIKFTFKEYPSQAKRIAAKKKYIAASKRADLKALEKKRQKTAEKKLGL